MKLPMNKRKQFTPIFIALLTAFLWNQLVYSGARIIAHNWHHYDMTTPLDQLVPFVPWTITIYFGCYAFWGVNYWLCANQDENMRNRFFLADILAKSVCFVLFLAIPTTNIRPIISNNSLWGNLMRFLYKIDDADNLFPSIHCLVSWLCWIGVRKRKDIPTFYRWLSLVFAVAVCISTLTTRQHVIADVIGGVVLAEICYIITGFKRINFIYNIYISLVGKILK